MKIILVGAKGIMGGHVINAANKEGYEISALVDLKCNPDVKGEYTKISDVSEKADVIIDFSFHGLVKEITDYAVQTGTPIIVATTGHTDDERKVINEASKKVAVFYSGNMSVGIATLCDVVKRVVSVFPNADVEIIETHHKRKLDAPSGTAKMLFNSVKEVRENAYAHYGRSGNCKREKNEIGINSVRVGNIVGIHEVIIGTDTEQITLKHEAFDRALFADGAIKAAEFMAGKNAGFYTMTELLKS